MRATRSVLPILAGAAIVMSLSCEWIADLDVKQCSKDADCGKYGDQYAGYACQDDVCVDFKCTDDASCRARGGAYADNICDATEKMCVAPECKMDMECQGDDGSPTATCNLGRCVDETWGCLKAPEVDAPETLNFQGPVIDFSFGHDRVKVPGARALLCRSSPPGCMPPVKTAVSDSNGLVKIKIDNVLPGGFDGYIRIEAEGFMPTEFPFPRPLRRDFVITDSSPMAVLTVDTINSFTAYFESQGLVFDAAEKALITLRLYDCQDKPANNLRLTTNGSAAARFYITDDAFAPDLDSSGTDEAGIGGLANVDPGYQTISVIYNPTGKELFHFRILSAKATFVLGFIHAKDVRSADD
jgi:hypothetical protein